uniref:F-box domain-containing protein n=1 Tax=Acrobeloides nanus TaxID=290746 RepID=A0A914CPS6_9BILA
MQPEYRETRTSPEILCDVLKFLSKDHANQCQRVCWWWNEVIKDAEEILPRKYICYLVLERYPRWHALHYDGKYSYSSPWCTGYTAFDCSWCEGIGFFMMAKAHFGQFTLEFSDFFEAIPKLHGIVKENQQPVSVSRFVSNPWAEPEKLPTLKDLPTFASFLEFLFEGLIIADNMELGFRTAACIRSEDLMRIAKIPVKMKWEFKKDPEENISDEEILKLIKEMKRFGNKYTLHIRSQNPEKFHHFLYENLGSLNGLDKKFSAKIYFKDYLSGIMDDDKWHEIAKFMKSLPKVQIEEYEKPFDRKHTIRRTHYNFIQDDVLFQVRKGEHSFGFGICYTIKHAEYLKSKKKNV